MLLYVPVLLFSQYICFYGRLLQASPFSLSLHFVTESFFLIHRHTVHMNVYMTISNSSIQISVLYFRLYDHKFTNEYSLLNTFIRVARIGHIFSFTIYTSFLKCPTQKYFHCFLSGFQPNSEPDLKFNDYTLRA